MDIAQARDGRQAMQGEANPTKLMISRSRSYINQRCVKPVFRVNGFLLQF